MLDIISAKLAEIEKEENVRVIYAVESGSRAWGFASPDSDYDVRFIYARPKEFYLKLEKTRDVIEWQLDETLDINGWDLQKTLRLIHSSNPTIFEWNRSPIVYKTTPEWDSVRAGMPEYFQTKAGLYHYYSTGLNQYRIYFKGETVKLKKYFYVLRPLLACKWILNKKCPPPVLFGELVETELEQDIKPIVDDLLRQKTDAPETGEIKHIGDLNGYIEKNFVSLKAAIDGLPGERNTGWDGLNKLFLSIINY